MWEFEIDLNHRGEFWHLLILLILTNVLIIPIVTNKACHRPIMQCNMTSVPYCSDVELTNKPCCNVLIWQSAQEL